MPLLTELSYFLDTYLQIEQYPGEKHGIWKPAGQAVSCLVLALEPWPGLSDWLQNCKSDALFLHRPWKLDFTLLPVNTGLLSYHLPFDEKLTPGYNVLLARLLDLSDIQPLGEKEGRALGMSGKIPALPLEALINRIKGLFGQLEQIHEGGGEIITRIALMGAMTDALVREAAAKDVQVYITGQFRKPAFQAVDQTGMHVLAVGHRQSEVFGLQLLASLLKEKWPAMHICIAPFPGCTTQ